MIRILRLLIPCLAAILATPAAANLIVNGSFETPVVPNAGFTNFPAGSTAITGWTVVGVDSAVINKNFTQSGITFQSQDGNQFIDLAGITSNSNASGVTQTILTVVGQTYEVSFYVGSSTDATSNHFFFPSTVDLSIAGGARVHYTNPVGPTNMLNWQLFVAPFTATGTTTSITFLNGSASNNFESMLDNVVVNAVPEPRTIMQWRSVRAHAGAGDLGIVLDPAASGNGLTGPTVEPRQVGIQRIEVDFNNTVTIANSSAITIVGRTTAGGVLGGDVAYTPASVTMAGPTTMAITFNAAPAAGFLPDETCYVINIPSSALNEGLTGDKDVMVRALLGDATGSGDATLSDAILTKTKTGAVLATNVRYDMDLSDTINITDAEFAKGRVNSPSHKSICP